MYHIISSVLTHPGQKRGHNEDFVAFFEPEDKVDLEKSGRLYIVSDGVGGASKGERASQYATQKVVYEYFRSPSESPSERLSQLLREAGNDIFNFAENSSTFMRMATTMVAAVIRENILTIANVGDSRAYLIRDGVVSQISNDHSLVAELVRGGSMTEEEARVSKQKNKITRSLGGEQNARVDIFDNISLEIGDKVLLCSDGFSQYADRNLISQFTEKGTVEEISAKMIDHANNSGGSDNISVILIEVLGLSSDKNAVAGARGQKPGPVKWDDFPTDYGFGASEKTKNSKYKLLLGGLSIAFIIICGYLGIYVKDTIFPPEITETATVSEFIVTEVSSIEPFVIAATITPYSTNISTSTSAPDISFGGSVTETNTPEPIYTETVAPSATPGQTNTPDPNGLDSNEIKNCIYQVKAEDETDVVVMLQTNFNLEFTTYDSFFEEYGNGIQCTDDPADTCSYNKGDYADSHNTIVEGWTLILPDIPVSVCQDAGGEPQNLN